MSRPLRQTLIRAVEEPSYGAGTLSMLTPADAAVVIDPSHRILRTLVPREIWMPHMGASEQLVSARVAEITFEMEITGSGNPAVAPPWARYLRACGFAEVLRTARIEWNPVSAGFSSLFFDYVRSGTRYVSRGARGTALIRLPAFGIPRFRFRFLGFETNAAVTGALPAYDLSAWRRPVVLTDANAGDIRIGCAFASGSVSGGTVLASRGLEIDLGGRVEHMELLGGERVAIVDREVTGKMSTALTPADEVAWRNEINANTNLTLGFNWGTAAGDRFTLWAPRVQRVDPQGEDYKGDLLLATELRLQPTATGNDDLILVAR